MASLQVLFALAFVCLAGQASATLKDHCSDVSFWDVVKYKTSSRQCCTPAELKQTCVWKNENVCKDVTELKCEPIAWAECKTKTTSIHGKKCEVEYKDYDFKDCKEVKFNTSHTKQVPECKQVTKHNCVTDWEVDASGNKVWAGSETCAPVTWEECKIVEKQVDFPSVKSECSTVSHIKWADFAQRTTDSTGLDTTCEVKSTVDCKTVTDGIGGGGGEDIIRNQRLDADKLGEANILATNTAKDGGKDDGAGVTPRKPRSKGLQEETTTVQMPRTPQRKRRRGGGVENIVREDEDSKEDIANVSADMGGSNVWIRPRTVRLHHEEAGLSDHPAAAEDAKKGTDSSAKIDRNGEVPGVSIAGKTIWKEPLTPKLQPNENGDPGGGGGKVTGGKRVKVPKKGAGSSGELDPGQEQS